MGLDAYLMAERNNTTLSNVKDNFIPMERPTEAVYVRNEHGGVSRAEVCWPIKTVVLEIQYWRKHWDLHDYINSTHASPDEYNNNPMRVDLSPEMLRDIAYKIRGFSSSGDLIEDPDPRYRHHTEREEYAKKFDLAADWILFDPWDRNVYYVGDY